MLSLILSILNLESIPVFIPDSSQKRVIKISEGKHLVLAPPGCGKTQILAERIHLALEEGVKAEDMLCLTFTNRAARGMRERIESRVGKEQASEVFVGNVHRFCSRFLFTNNIVPAESAIIDDDTIDSILARYLNEDEEIVKRDFRRRHMYAQIMFFSHLMYDIIHAVPRELRIHPECVTREDIATMKAIAKATDKTFDAKLMIDIYNHADFYLDLIHQPVFPSFLRHEAEQSLMKMRYAHAYVAYKTQNNLLDFEDLLQLTYHTLTTQPDSRRYPWIQVDEVQDLNLLQLAIISQLRAESGCFLYLGDEQQAIFSFMGAKLVTLNILKEQCKDKIHHLSINHRQPQRIVQMLNDYAIANLHSAPALLPTPSDEPIADNTELRVCPAENIWAEYKAVAKRVKGLLKTNKNETTAIIVNANRDADEISNRLTVAGISHFKISGTDLFSTPEVKLMMAHLSVVNNEHNFLAWAQILQGLKICATAASARQWIHKLKMNAITPTDLLHEGDTYLQQFLKAWDENDLIVFDTETTGLNIFEDDIIQIAAERIRNGKSVAKFSVYLETKRPIPAMLGDIVNPIIEERKHHQLLSPADGLQAFLQFSQGAPLLAHNASFDCHIMQTCLNRYFPDIDWAQRWPVCFDSLKLIRLLRPDLKAFKLKLLLAELGLEGENSHLADDDVNATVSLAGYCYTKGKESMVAQEAFLKMPTTKKIAERLRRNYGKQYQAAVSKCYLKPADRQGVPALVEELRRFYHALEEEQWIRPVDKIEYVFRFLATDIIHQEEEPSLKEQLDNHIMEINTFKEADLCGSTIMQEKVFVSTIHKAKGLEFNNVIIFDAVDGRLPNFHNQNDPKLMDEDARKLYVALSRARRRIFVYYSQQAPSTANLGRQKLSRFMKPVIKYFDKVGH